MSWLKEKLQDWLEIKVQYWCSHRWEILETKKVEVLFQLPREKNDRFYLPNIDSKTYITTNTKYIMKCTKCGELQAKVL